MYLREVTRFLALVCILREDNFEKQGNWSSRTCPTFRDILMCKTFLHAVHVIDFVRYIFVKNEQDMKVCLYRIACLIDCNDSICVLCCRFDRLQWQYIMCTMLQVWSTTMTVHYVYYVAGLIDYNDSICVLCCRFDRLQWQYMCTMLQVWSTTTSGTSARG